MDLNYFKDLIFDTINESSLPIQDIDTHDRDNLMIIKMIDGSVFTLRSSRIEDDSDALNVSRL